MGDSKAKMKSAATAGPSKDDRFGGGFVAANLEANIIGSPSVAGGRTLVMISKGKLDGVALGVEGYVKSSQGMLAELTVISVSPHHCQALVTATPDQLRLHRRVVINPTSKPTQELEIAKPARIIGMSVEDGRTLITIARGKTHGVTSDLTGRLYAENGRTGESFQIAYTHAIRSYAYVAATTDQVSQFGHVKFDPPAKTSGAPVQRRATGATSTADVQSTAQAGVANASSPLPFLDTIQRAFGKHDVSNIQAQVGGAASTASDALGARAYATGNKVAFASAPDLHTAAHEAAHVVQQRRGAVGFQGLGAADDEHERHADAVADAVVAGQSAEPLLDRLASGPSTEAIQRKPFGPEASPVPSSPSPSRTSEELEVIQVDDGVSVQIGQSAILSVFIRNNARRRAQVDGLVLDPEAAWPGWSRSFEVTQIVPATVEPGATAMALIRFSPRSSGAHRAEFSLHINGKPDATIPLSALAVKAKDATRAEPAKEKEQDNSIEVGLVDGFDLGEQRSMPYDRLLDHHFNLIEASLHNFRDALDNFESIAKAPSSKETIEEDKASIIFGEVAKHYKDHLGSYVLKVLPLGSELGEFLAFGSWSEAIQKEKGRARTAGEDHVLMKYIVGTRKWIAAERSKLAKKATIIHSETTKHAARSDVEQALDRNDIMVANERLDQHVSAGAGTAQGHFSMIVVKWIEQTRIPGTQQKSQIRIRYDRDWNLMFAKLEAPRGERIAEELANNGPVDLQSMRVRRVIEWMPHLTSSTKHPHFHQASLFIARVIDESGATVETRWSEMATSLKPEFEAKVATLVLPKVTAMSGTSAK